MKPRTGAIIPVIDETLGYGRMTLEKVEVIAYRAGGKSSGRTAFVRSTERFTRRGLQWRRR